MVIKFINWIILPSPLLMVFMSREIIDNYLPMLMVIWSVFIIGKTIYLFKK